MRACSPWRRQSYPPGRGRLHTRDHPGAGTRASGGRSTLEGAAGARDSGNCPSVGECDGTCFQHEATGQVGQSHRAQPPHVQVRCGSVATGLKTTAEGAPGSSTRVVRTEPPGFAWPALLPRCGASLRTGATEGSAARAAPGPLDRVQQGGLAANKTQTGSGSATPPCSWCNYSHRLGPNGCEDGSAGGCRRAASDSL